MQQKQDLQAELNETANRIGEAKSIIEHKFDQKRKAFKEAEITFQKKITVADREKAILTQKLSNDQKLNTDLIKKLEAEKEKFNEQITSL